MLPHIRIEIVLYLPIVFIGRIHLPNRRTLHQNTDIVRVRIFGDDGETRFLGTIYVVRTSPEKFDHHFRALGMKFRVVLAPIVTPVETPHVVQRL